MASISLNLTGQNPFYNHKGYTTNLAIKSWKPVKAYSYTSPSHESRVWRAVKEFFLFLPKFLYGVVHSLVGKIIVPASWLFTRDQIQETDYRDTGYKIQRIFVEVDGNRIDGVIMGTEESFETKRWTLVSEGNGGSYEERVTDHSLRNLLTKCKSNAILFNYPGVGDSEGTPTRSSLVKAYQAMLHFLEDEEKGLGAQEIIGYGFSLGGAVQGEALLSHELKGGIKYVFVKDRTFSDLSSVVSQSTFRVLGLLVRVLGWNMSSVESSKKLRAPEIILQVHNKKGKVIDDGVIPAEASLKVALVAKEHYNGDKDFMGITGRHSSSLVDEIINYLSERIKQKLSDQ